MLAAVLPAGGHGQTHTSAPISAEDQAEFRQATTALATGDNAQALLLLEKLHSRHPANFQINESLGLGYASGGQLTQAASSFAVAAREQPESGVAHANLGTAYLKLGRTQEALTELSRAAALQPGDPQTETALGQAWMLSKQPCQAAAAFAAVAPGTRRGSAAGQQPGEQTSGAQDAASADPDLVYNHALALFDCGKPEGAAALLTAMPTLSSSAPALSLLGDSDEALHRYKEAAQSYASAAALAPTEANVYLLGIEFLRHWTFAPAIHTFEAGIKAYPESRRMVAGLGIAYYGAAQYNDAIRVFASLLDKDPDNTMYGEIFGRACTVLTDSEDPLCTRLTSLAQKHPANPDLALYAATAILHQPADPQQQALAQSLLTGALRSDPKLAEAHYQLGVLLQTEGKWAESAPELSQAIALDPTYARAHYRLGLAYAHTGRKQQAQTEMALDRSESEQKQDDLNARMRQITTLVVKMQ